MKKASVLGVLAGLVLVGVLYYFVSNRPAIQRTAATLVPGDSLAFLYLPDIARSTERWKDSSIHALLQEPEVKAFLDSTTKEDGRMNRFKSYLDRIVELKPEEAFIGLQSINGDKPKFVAGLRFSGDRAKLEALVKEAGDYVKTLTPTGTADLVQRGSKTIETYTSQKVTLAATFHEDWYLIGSGVPEIEQTLMSFRGDEKESLANREAFREALTHLPEDYDSLVFIQPGALAERLTGLFGAAGMAGEEERLAQFKDLRAVAATTKMDGRKMRDSALALWNNRPVPVELTGRTARFAAPSALLYYAAAIQAAADSDTPGQDVMGTLDLVPLFALLGNSLASHEVSITDLPKAVGPEIGMALEWSADGGTPKPTLAVEVRDRALAEKFVAALIDPRLSGMEAARIDEGGTIFYTMPETPYGSPTLALNDEFLALGLDKASLAEALKGEAETLSGTEHYQKAMERLPEATVATGYVDAKATFERLYGTVRPMLIMMAALGQHGGAQADFGKLPETETIARHLGPIAISQSTVDGGVLIESEGSLTVNQALGGIGAAVVWMAGPLISDRLQEGLGTLSGGMLSVPGSTPAVPAPSPEPTTIVPPAPPAGATPLQTPGYVSPVPDTMQDESINPPISDETPIPAIP